MTELANVISTLGFPVVACVGLAYFCKYMIDNNYKQIEKMFDMYAKANEENRTAIEKLTTAVDKLCDKIDKEEPHEK